ncbi:MAG: hypothetical protein ACN6OG_17045 [Chryseobacterium rhizosphaerae]|nr:hypothetical protein [Chryseobacterium sp. KMC2]
MGNPAAILTPPTTSNLARGFTVPIPTFPLGLTVI